MKKLFSRIFPLLMAFVMIFSFAACGGDNNTTVPESSTKEEEVNASVEETSSTVKPTEDTSETSETDDTDVPPSKEDKDETTTKAKVKINAPVNGSIAQIVKFYNDHANATKAYKGTVKIAKTEGSTSKFTEIKGPATLLKGVLNSVLAKATGEPKSLNKTFKDGVSSDGDKLVKYLPPSGRNYISALEPAGVKSASCKQVGDNYSVEIKLIKEVVGYNGKPKWHDRTMDILTVDEKDVEPLEIVKDDSCKFEYLGATIKAVFDNQGRLKSLSIEEPVDIIATLKKGVSLNVIIQGCWKQDISFTY